MATEKPGQTPEGELIEAAVKASGQSIRHLSAQAGMSDTRWRHFIKGWQPILGDFVPARPRAVSLAWIAFVLDLSPEQLQAVGRADAVPELVRLRRDGLDRPQPVKSSQPQDEISMIYALEGMSAQQKLEAIRIVLQLRAEADLQA